MEEKIRKKLILEAMEARRQAYAPYSRYQVGAALLAVDGEIVCGCNVENASYGASCCAERAAVFKREFRAIAIVGGLQGKAPEDFAYPCGICRQVLHEFAGKEGLSVIVAKSEAEYREHSLEELIPHGFGGGSIV